MFSRHYDVLLFSCSHVPKFKCCDVQTLWCSNAELPTCPPKYGRGFLLAPIIGNHVQLTHVLTFHRSNVVMFRCSGSAPATLGVPSTVHLLLNGESGQEPTVQGLSGAHLSSSSLPQLSDWALCLALKFSTIMKLYHQTGWRARFRTAPTSLGTSTALSGLRWTRSASVKSGDLCLESRPLINFGIFLSICYNNDYLCRISWLTNKCWN